jgi:transposase
MSVQPMPWPEPAVEIVAAVRAMYARREPPLPVAVRDRLGELFPDVEFAVGFGRRGRPGFSPGRLALVTVFQMVENLTDRQAADAVRDKISWKYALGLGLDDAGFDASVLSEFRARVIAHGAEQRVLDLLLERLIADGLISAGGKARTDSTHVIAAVRELNRLELAGESVRACVEAVAVAAPDWLAAAGAAGVIDMAEWDRRYGARVDSWRLPTSKTKRNALARAYGADAVSLLRAIHDQQAPIRVRAPQWLRELSAVEVVRVMLVQNYMISLDSAGREVIKMREADADGLPPARSRLVSPHDPDARASLKRRPGDRPGDELRWTGYKVHLTETCGTETSGTETSGTETSGTGDLHGARRLDIIVGVATTEATVPDVVLTEPIHAALAGRGLLPGRHYLDSGYSSAQLLVDTRCRWGTVMVSPVPGDKSRQAKAGAGFDRSKFVIDYDTRHASCPQGRTSTRWHPYTTASGARKISVKFAAAICRDCPVRDSCTTTTSRRYGRQLTVSDREVHDAQLAARARQDTPTWQRDYAIRAGVEATIAQGIAVTGMRRARYRGLAKTRLEHVFSAAALNLVRLHAYWHASPLNRTRTSHLDLVPAARSN